MKPSTVIVLLVVIGNLAWASWLQYRVTKIEQNPALWGDEKVLAEAFLDTPFDPSTAVPVDDHRMEVTPPPSESYEYGVAYPGPKGTKWQYVGGNTSARGAWRVTNHKGEFVMPRPAPGTDALTLYRHTEWRDVLGMTWRYTGRLDAVGDPLVDPPAALRDPQSR